MRFSQKIVAASSLLLIGTILLLSLHQLRTVKSSFESLVYSSLQELVSGVKNSITTDMQAKESLAQSMTEVIQLDPTRRDYVSNILETPKLKSSFVAVGLGYKDGTVVENDDNWVPTSAYDPRKRPWYIDVKGQGKLIVTEPYVDFTTKKIIISIATPVYDKGQWVGGMYYDLDLSGLSDVVNSIDLFHAGHLFIVTEKGDTIAHPNRDYNGKKFTEYLPGVQLKTGIQRVEIDGKDYLVNFTSVPSEHWYIGAVIDESIAFSTLSTLRNSSILYTIVGVVISLILLSLLIKRLIRPLGILNTAIHDIASGQGDLTKRLDTDLDQEFATLAVGFNQFTETLQQRIRQSKEISGDILQGIHVIAEHSGQSAGGMQSQMLEVDQLATAMNEMAATASEVAHNAQNAATAAKEADDASNEGSEVVSYTTHAINELSARIDQAVEEVEQLESATANIETILKVINDIADQTNLLALNAAIEAARAGESGRGFAVVADEVRTLAQRTQESTTEIRSMIEQLQSGASSVSAAMGESKGKAAEAVEKSHVANEALQRIRDAIQQISDMNIQIASAAEEQSLVAEEINNNMVKIKDISGEVAESAKGASHATQSQVDKVHQQEKILNQFIV
ncbi:methyl-accepting chemotaxis protein [Vibrio mangrovi]|uniref:Methyl-accepting chemotaxis protein n=1 Tax=Vibrio mangrovi TaxID=474394 RepID=A0A1Y6IS37_9VIBR|nr:methyl-accepting chemotaxis protein [Vibrio mangrovi]MDW6001538.1 methyl-accepting chemotaxis protein [Vibrio mangrovi]SMS00438.1 Methyl-accepting chemotaxis protein PctB [Vibrio mangrovi]